ncbi:MAG: FkbM family methyltransferase [Pirellulales bacterium]|nr:FkbM family methyltransferase [Pirellulales bacterium]
MSNLFVKSLRSLARRSAAARLALAPAIAANRALHRRKRAIQQACYEHLRQRLVEDPVLSIDECGSGAAFALDVRSDIFKRLMFNGDYEVDTMRLARRLVDPKRDALDIGANVGFFTVLLAKQLAPTGRRVLAVEPTPQALGRLRTNVQRNGVASAVTIFEGVVSNEPGTVEFTVVVGKEEYSCLSGARHPQITGEEGQEFTVQKQAVQASTVDELVERHQLQPGFLKVDVEGAELMAFQGAQKTLCQHRPIILSELYAPLLARSGSSIPEVLQFFRNRDYDVVDPSAPGAADPTFADAEMLAIPREKRAAVDLTFKLADSET